MPPPLKSLQVEGRVRELILTLPRGADNRTPLPLVIAFHGRTNSNAQARAYFGLERNLEHTAMVAYPSSLRQADGTYSWTTPGAPASRRPDIALFDTLLRVLEGRYCIDPARIYLVGHSLGASFANTLACARAGRVRAVAGVGGGIWVHRCRAPVAAMVIHNPDDRLVAMREGHAARAVFLAANRLAGAAATPLPGSALSCRRYGAAAERYPVWWCPHGYDYKANGKYYPHHWPRPTAAEITRFLRSLP